VTELQQSMAQVVPSPWAQNDNDFKPGSLCPSNKVVKTYDRGLKVNLKEGKLKWTTTTDAGVDASLPLDDSLLVLVVAIRIFSPQQWAQNMLKSYPDCEAKSYMRGGKEFI
jgi:hypothetical protein